MTRAAAIAEPYLTPPEVARLLRIEDGNMSAAPDFSTPRAAAHSYAELGLRTFPCHSYNGEACSCGRPDCSRAAKHPRCKHGLKDATTDPATIDAWYDQWPEANPAIATGSESGIVVVDMDPRHGGDKSLAGLEAENGPLPPTVEASTGGGGRHLAFKHPGGKVPTRTGGKAGLPDGIDVRGDGGYIIVPPSRHVSGGTYQWKNGHAPGEIPCAEMPAWLIELTRRQKRDTGFPVELRRAVPDDLDLLLGAATSYVAKAGGTTEGARNSNAFNLAGHLVAFEVEGSMLRLTEGQILDLMRTWNHRNDPPLDERELASTVSSAFAGNGAVRTSHMVKRKEIPTGHRDMNAPQTLVENTWPEPPCEAAFYGLAGEIVRAIEPHSEADPVALLIQILVAFGNVIGRTAYFTAEADRHYGNLFACLVGKTSKGRKGTSWGQSARFLAAVDPDWYGNRILSGLSSGEGLIMAVRDPTVKREPMRGNEATGKGAKGKVLDYQDVVVDAGVADKRMIALESEFGSVLRVMARDRNTLSAIIRQAWDTGTLRTLTKNSPAAATNAHISIVGHITGDELRRLLADSDMANGFANRFLWMCVQRSKCLPEGGNLHDADLAPLVNRMRQAVNGAASAGEMQRDEAARATWKAAYPDLSEGRPGLLGAATSRAEAQVMRLAMLYALLDQTRTIGAVHLDAGLALWDYADRSARHIFCSSSGDPTADTILRTLRTRPEGMTRTEITKLFSNNKPADEITRALDVLAEHGHASKDRSGGGPGRPPERWFCQV